MKQIKALGMTRLVRSKVRIHKMCPKDKFSSKNSWRALDLKPQTYFLIGQINLFESFAPTGRGWGQEGRDDGCNLLTINIYGIN